MRAACGLAAMLLLLAGAASAQQSAPLPVRTTAAPGGAISMGAHDKNAPINVSSDNFEGDFETKVGTYTGNVVVTQADYKLRADKVRVEVVAGKPNRMTANGNVVFVSSSGTATGDTTIYDLGPGTVTMTGKVVLTKGKDVMRGTLLVINMNSGLAHLTAKGLPGGRVQSTFVPNHATGKGGTRHGSDQSSDASDQLDN